MTQHNYLMSIVKFTSRFCFYDKRGLGLANTGSVPINRIATRVIITIACLMEIGFE